MREFEIQIKSVRDVLTFVNLATSRPFDVTVGNEYHQVNGKSFMEMFCLDFSHPLRVICNCTDEDFDAICRDADRFLVK